MSVRVHAVTCITCSTIMHMGCNHNPELYFAKCCTKICTAQEDLQSKQINIFQFLRQWHMTLVQGPAY